MRAGTEATLARVVQVFGAAHPQDTGNTALATTPLNSVSFASGSNRVGVVLSDRVLLFGGQYALATTVVWLNKGVAQ
jgi:hypothetical protein